ncbi:MAG: hypothetical protein ACI30N_07410 [Muribaculaceae bacterium]
MSEEFPYEDIVNLPHLQSGRHPQMPLESRAAQFAPFAALTGHSDAIAETARRTDDFPELSADELLDLSRRLTYAMSFPEPPSITITFFRPDIRKTGGAYVTVTGTIKKLEPAYNLLTLTDGTQIPLSAITALQSPIFTDLDP